MNRKDLIEEEIDRFLAMAKREKAKAVILFGSRAKGEHTEESDCDICLISDDLPHDLFRRRYLAPSAFRSLSVFGFYPQEFLDMLEDGNLFILDILEEGKTLYDNGFLREAQIRGKEVIEEYHLKKEENGWTWDKDRVRKKTKWT
jgi:hypothetical protein